MEWTLKRFTEGSRFLRELYLKRHHHLEVKGTWWGQNKKRHLDLQVSTNRKQPEKTSQLWTLSTLNENGRMTKRPKPRAQRTKLRVIEDYSQTSTWDLSKVLDTFAWWDFRIGGISYMLPLFFPLWAGVFMAVFLCLSHHCVLSVWEQITCCFSCICLQIERNRSQGSAVQGLYSGTSSVPRPNLDGEGLYVQLMLWGMILLETMGGVSVYFL